MSSGGTQPPKRGYNVLLIDSDPDFLSRSCKAIAADGYRAWAVEDLLAAANFLADQTPDVLAVELELVEADGADPLGDLRARAPGSRTILMTHGAPGERLRTLLRTHEIFGYHDKAHGCEGLCLWVEAALGAARQVEMIRQTRVGLRRLLESVPHLHRSQSLGEVMQAILEEVNSLIGGKSAFVAARISDPVGRPPVEGFGDEAQMIDDYVVGASNTSSYAPGTTVDRLRSVPVHLVQRAVEERTNVLDDKHGVLPLALAEQVLGLAYLNRPAPGERDLDLLQLFASQAAAAVRNAALYELATVDSTTRVFRKSFTLERLVETLKLAWRKSFPVSALMLDIDDFRDLNARHGHIVGDRTLRHLAALLRANVRDSDIVGRFGGDEFLAVLIDANHEGAAVVLRRLYGALGRESGRPRPEGLPPVRATLGAAALEPGDGSYRTLGFPDFRRVAETLVAEADEAMYRVRREPAAAGEVPALSWTRFFAG